MSIIERELPVIFPSEWVAPAPVTPEPAPELTDVEKVVALLRLSADLLEEKGWTTGEYRDERGRFCALGAMEEATRQLFSPQTSLSRICHEPIYQKAIQRMAIAVFGDWRRPIKTVASWNDRKAILSPPFARWLVQRKLRKTANEIEKRGVVFD